MQNSMVVFTFSVLDQKNPFWSKDLSCLFKIKFDSKTNLNMQNSIVVSILPVWGWKYSFLGEFAKKIKIFSLSWKLVPRLIRIWRIRWWCSFFSVFDWKYSFFGNFFQNSKLKICQIQWWFSFFLDRKYPL